MLRLCEAAAEPNVAFCQQSEKGRLSNSLNKVHLLTLIVMHGAEYQAKGPAAIFVAFRNVNDCPSLNGGLPLSAEPHVSQNLIFPKKGMRRQRWQTEGLPEEDQGPGLCQDVGRCHASWRTIPWLASLLVPIADWMTPLPGLFLPALLIDPLVSRVPLVHCLLHLLAIVEAALFP